jgi:uracil-DNA glycosylase
MGQKIALTTFHKRVTSCKKCPRLIRHCRDIAKTKRKAYLTWDYWGRPVSDFGDPSGEVLIVGLAPAAHGANRTGRFFTGDRSGDWLFRALHKAKFANQASATHIADGLELNNCVVTAICRCAPPANKPTAEEISNCRRWFAQSLIQYPTRIYLALGILAFKELWSELVNRALTLDKKIPKFGHGKVVRLAQKKWLVCSYHPSQQNTFTGRLTEPMFDAVFAHVIELLKDQS